MYQKLLQTFSLGNREFYERSKVQLVAKWVIFASIFLFVYIEGKISLTRLNIGILMLPPLIFNLYWSWLVLKDRKLSKTGILGGIYLDALVVSVIISISKSVAEMFILPPYLIISFMAYGFGFAESLPFILVISAVYLARYLSVPFDISQFLVGFVLRVISYLVVAAIARYAGTGEQLLESSRVESEELAKDLEKRLRQLSVLYEINRSIRLSFNMEELIKSALAQINSALRLNESLVCVTVCADKEDSSVCFTAKGRLEEPAPIVCQSLGRKIKESKEPVVINDLSKELYWNCDGANEARSLIASPLSNESRDFGFIVGMSYQPNQFNIEDLQLLVAVANEMAVCIQNSRLYQHLQKEKQFSVNLLETAGSIVVGMDTQGKITTFNQIASKVTGCRKEEVLGKNWFEHFVPGASAHDALQVVQALSEGNFPSQFENPLLSKEGELRTISWNGTTVRNEDNEVVGILTVGQDITERKLMEEKIVRRNRQLAAFGEIARATTESLDLQEVLDHSLQKTLGLVEADSGIIYILDSQKKHLRVSAHEGLSADLVKSADNLELGEGFAGRVAQTGESMLVDDITKDERLTRTAAAHEGLRSLADIPLTSSGKLVGVLGVYRHRLRPFAEEEKDILIAIGRGIAMAIQNAYLFEMEKVRLEQIESLYQSAKVILSRLEINDTLEVLGKQAMRGLKAQCAMVTLHNSQSDEMEAKAIVGLGKIEEDQMRQVRFKRGEGTPGYILETGEPLLLSDTEKNPLYAGKKEKAGIEVTLRSSVTVPIKVKGKVIGAIDVANKMPQEIFDEGDLAFLVALGDLAAIAIENARLYEEAKQKVDELSLFYEVGQTLSSILDIEKLLEVVAFSVASLARAESCTVMLLDPNTNELIVQAARGPLLSSDINAHLKVGEGVAGRAVEERRPILVDDVSQDNRFTFRKQKESKIRSLLSVPMLSRGKVIGAINVANKIQERTFSEDDVRMLSTVANEVAIALENVELYRDMQELSINTVRALAKAIDARDTNTRNHSENVTIYTVAIAEEMGLPGEEIETIRWAGLLHDIGKIGIPEAILHKPEGLNEEEYEYMKKHPQIGAIILEPIKPLSSVIPLIQYHHENYDGSGYPEGLKGNEIPLGARIIRIADSFDAMISSRPNRDYISVSEAITELERCSGKEFDPQAVETFVRNKIWNKVLKLQQAKA